MLIKIAKLNDLMLKTLKNFILGEFKINDFLKHDFQLLMIYKKKMLFIMLQILSYI